MRKYALLAVLIACPSVRAQTTYPTLLGAHPTGVQRGKTTDILVYGEGLADAYCLLFDGDARDFKATIRSDGKKGPLAVRLTVAAEARPGIREFRVATPQGASSVAALVVGDEVDVLGAGNDTPDKAQAVTIPVTVHGKLDRAFATDWYRFRVEAGAEVSFAVLAARLQNKLWQARHWVDPELILTDDRGRELASNNDSFGADSFLRYRFARADEYRIAIRDVFRDGLGVGDARSPSPYRLTITRQPVPLNVYPLAVARGREVALRPTQAGDPPRTLTPVKMRIPADWEPGIRALALPSRSSPSSLVPLLVADLPISHKQRPNNTPEKAILLPVNSGINGCIDAPGDVEWFRFQGRKGTTYELEVFARRCQSDLDSILSVHDARGSRLRVITKAYPKTTVEDFSDDTILDTIPNPAYMITTTKDSRLIWTAPTDGPFYIRLADLQGGGGPSFPYFLTCRVAQPDFVLRCEPDDKANLGPGCSVTWHLHLERRHGFRGPVRVEVQGLPEGVSSSHLVIHEKKDQACLVLTASADARVQAARVRVLGTATVKNGDGRETTLVRECRPIQEHYHFGGREFVMVKLHTVAVTNTSPLVIAPSVTEPRLTAGGSVRIDFTVKRGPGLPASTTLSFGHLIAGVGAGSFQGANPFPPGIKVDLQKSKLRLASNETKGWIVLKAAADVEPIAEIPFTLMVNVGINRHLVVYSTPALYLTVKRTDR